MVKKYANTLNELMVLLNDCYRALNQIECHSVTLGDGSSSDSYALASRLNKMLLALIDLEQFNKEVKKWVK